MKSGVDETLDLPDMDKLLQAMDAIDSQINKAEEETALVTINDTTYDSTIDNDYKQVAQEMDDIADTAQQAFETVLGCITSVPPKDIGSIAMSAQTFLNTKLQAKMFKSKYKLDKANLSLKKEKMEQDKNKDKSSGDDSDTLNLTAYDRNSLI